MVQRPMQAVCTAPVSSSSQSRRALDCERVRAIGFGGDAIGPRYLYVHSSKERIEQAKVQWREMRFALPATDRDDVIPLPADQERPLRILNGASPVSSSR
jgi:hypothetical protein